MICGYGYSLFSPLYGTKGFKREKENTEQSMNSDSSSSKQSSSSTNRSYFTESKKGEVNELKNLMRNINVEKDGKRKRDIIKKAIAYMTLGLDVSRLFTEMVMAVETKDIVVKKMVYFYLGNYAKSNPEMALMTCNTLNRDCDDEDPMVRGLALRSITGIRLPEMAEYMVEPIKRGLQDVSPYVRKTSVMVCIVVYCFVLFCIVWREVSFFLLLLCIF